MDRNVLLATTRSEFLRAFLQAVAGTIPRTVTQLFHAADRARNSHDQRRLMGAHQLLRINENPLQEHLRRTMDQLLNRSFQTTYSTFRPSFFSSYAGNDLALVDANLYEDQLHINEVTAAFRDAADEQLRDLNIRVAILFEQDTINERENPFRPFLFARAIVSAVDCLGNLSELNVTVADHLAADLTETIATVYTRVNAHLAEHGIGAQLQLKIKKTASAAPAPNPSPSPSADADMNLDNSNAAKLQPQQGGYVGAAHTQDDGHRILSNDQPRGRVEQLFAAVMGRVGNPASGTSTIALDEETVAETPNANWLGAQGMVGALQNFLFGAPSRVQPQPDLDNAGKITSAAAGVTDTGTDIDSLQTTSAGAPLRQISDKLSRALQALMRSSGDDSVDGAMAPAGHSINRIVAQRQALHRTTGDLNEQMTIDVVGMLFEFILRDGQIPAEVRAQLGRLQFLVLKIALREPTLLTQKSHPARMLVNRIGSVSVGLRQLDPSGARVSTEILRIVETLLAEPIEDSQLFEIMLDQFDSFIAHELRASDSRVDRAVQAVENAQSRTLRFAHLTAQLAEALNGLTIDPFLQDFLSTTWIHVIERIERAPDSAKESRQFRQLVPDLMWSILPKNRADERNQLIGMLRPIVATVRQGLQRLGWDNPRQRLVLDWLVDAHSNAMRSPETGAAGLALASLYRHFDNFIAHPERKLAQQSAAQDSNPAHQEFLDEALLESDVNVQMLDPLIAHAEVLPAAPAVTSISPDSVATIAQAPESAIDSEATLLQRLRSGVAIEITLGSQPGLGRLNWINQDASTLVLTMDEAAKPSMVSVRMFLRLLALRRVRFIESAPLFERAVAGLLKSAQEVEQAS